MFPNRHINADFWDHKRDWHLIVHEGILILMGCLWVSCTVKCPKFRLGRLISDSCKMLARKLSQVTPPCEVFRRISGGTCNNYVCLCFFFVFSSHSFWTSMDVPAGVTQEEGNTGFSIHLPSAVLALIFLARRIQPFSSLVDREVEFCVLTI